MNVEQFKNLIDVASDNVGMCETRMRRILLGITTNICTAWDEHKAFEKTLILPPEPMDPTIFLEIALVLVAGGLGGKVADLMKVKQVVSKTVEPFFLDAAKDLVKYTVRTTGGAAGKSPAPHERELKTLGNNPRKWAPVLESWIANDIEFMRAVILHWRRGVAGQVPGFKMDFNPDTQMQAMLVVRAAALNATDAARVHGATMNTKAVVASKPVISIFDLPVFEPNDPENVRQLKCALFGAWLKKVFPLLDDGMQRRNKTMLFDYAASLHDHPHLRYLRDQYTNVIEPQQEAATRKMVEEIRAREAFQPKI